MLYFDDSFGVYYFRSSGLGSKFYQNFCSVSLKILVMLKGTRLYELIEDGQLPIAKQNIQGYSSQRLMRRLRSIISKKSRDADMTIIRIPWRNR